MYVSERNIKLLKKFEITVNKYLVEYCFCFSPEDRGLQYTTETFLCDLCDITFNDRYVKI